MGGISSGESGCSISGSFCTDYHHHYRCNTQFEACALFDEEEDIFYNTPTASASPTTDKWFKDNDQDHDNEDEDPLLKKKKKRQQVYPEGYVEKSSGNEDDDELGRTKSLTDEDLEELKGCLDLGFGFFSYDEIPELYNTLPVLELCYSMSQKYLDEQHQNHKTTPPPPECSASTSNIANWKISSPGDHPEDVKARLKFWAQAVACTVRLCRKGRGVP